MSERMIPVMRKLRKGLVTPIRDPREQEMLDVQAAHHNGGIIGPGSYDDKWWMRAVVIERLDDEKRKQCINSWSAFHFKNRDFVERIRRECYRA